MRDLLVRYLLGDLSPDERQELETRLLKDRPLQKELERLRACFDQDQAHESCSNEAPAGLADRTAACLSQLNEPASRAARSNPAPFTFAERSPQRSRVTLVDAVVAVGVVFAVGLLLLPALTESRDRARRSACKENLRQLGIVLTQYSQKHRGFFPPVFPGENAGMFTVRLAGSGLIDREELASLLVCPASEGVQQRTISQIVVRVPSEKDLQSTRGESLAFLLRWMGGSYGYRLGYVEKGRYYPIRNQRNSRSPILGDAPTLTPSGWRSMNHGGCGQNLLFQDNSVKYVTDCQIRSIQDPIYVNAHGKAAAGQGWNDVVLVRSDMTPGVTRVVLPVSREDFSSSPSQAP